MNIFGMDIFVDTFGRIFFVILKATVSMALLITANDLKTTELSTYIMSLRHSRISSDKASNLPKRDVRFILLK